MTDCDNEIFSGLYLTPAYYNVHGEPAGPEDEIDLETSIRKMNETHQEGFRFKQVTAHGIAVWEIDSESVSEVMGEGDTCGTCAHFDGNMCGKTRVSVIDDSLPMMDDCYVRR
jgi:hypothetical protein